MRLTAAPEHILGPVTVTADGDEFTVTELLLTSEPTEFVTVTVPEGVPESTVTEIEVEELEVIVTGEPPIVTDVAPDKAVPVIVKVDPSQILDVDNEVIFGVAAIVNRVFGLYELLFELVLLHIEVPSA